MLWVKVDAEIVRNMIGGKTETLSGSMEKNWFDPLLVVRMKLPEAGKWQLQARSDIGGFGVGSDLTWQVQAYAGYRFTELFQLTVGYRALGIDYEKGADKDRLKYDVTTFGPVVKLGFNF
jgi:hypothetical protein